MSIKDWTLIGLNMYVFWIRKSSLFARCHPFIPFFIQIFFKNVFCIGNLKCPLSRQISEIRQIPSNFWKSSNFCVVFYYKVHSSSVFKSVHIQYKLYCVKLLFFKKSIIHFLTYYLLQRKICNRPAKLYLCFFFRTTVCY